MTIRQWLEASFADDDFIDMVQDEHGIWYCPYEARATQTGGVVEHIANKLKHTSNGSWLTSFFRRLFKR